MPALGLFDFNMPPTPTVKRPLPIALAALHRIAGWGRGYGQLTEAEKIAREALAELGIKGPVR